MKRNTLLLCSALSLSNAVGCDSSSNKPTPNNTTKSNPAETIPEASVPSEHDANSEPKTVKAELDVSVPATSDANSAPKTAKAEPDYITVQHCLIGFKGSLPGVTRTKGEALDLATKLLAELKAGADFDEIIRKNTDDSPPGIYKMANRGKKFDMSQGVFSRDGMVPAFGDTGFPLEVGEYGLAVYDAEKSPYGWHIVKRTK